MKKLISVLAVLTIVVVSAGLAISGEKRAKELNSKNYPLKGSHLESNLACADCHGEDKTFKKLVKQDACFSCHDNYDELAKRTEKLGYDDNIHASPHYPKMDCDLCHKIHDPKPTKTVYCAMCHSQKTMDMMVP